MDITCKECGKTVKIPDEKVPRGKTFSINCPGCKEKISVNPQNSAPKAKRKPAEPAASKKPATNAAPPAGADEQDDEAPENPFQFLEEGARLAMICESEPDIRARIRKSVEGMDYHIFEAQSPREALKQMRFNDFHLVILNEMFGTRDPDMNHVMKYLSQLNMFVRRNMFVALLTNRFRTGDNMQAFHKSVNLIINLSDTGMLEKVIEHGINDNDMFYKVYKEEFARIRGV